MTTKVAFIGKGEVAKALARGLEHVGHEVRTVGTEAGAVREAVRWSEIVCIALPRPAMLRVVHAVAPALEGRVVVDASNALQASANEALGYATSSAEALQESAPGAKVVKAFNVIMAQQLEHGHPGGQSLTTLVAGDDADAKRVALEIAREIGFVAIDAGPLKNARILEAMPVLNTQLGYFLGLPDVDAKVA